MELELELDLDSCKAFKEKLDFKVPSRMSETSNVPIVRCYKNHDKDFKYEPCKIDERNSLTHVWCSVHNSAEYSCMYNDQNSTFNAVCHKCCSENTQMEIQFEFVTE